ncbi:hypothetical protein PR048_002817 [Dryococelus australis]|uniref:Uncharacterized protein n=1 Tax=Dryococelus australis TaxID=614101 RepID=A0ABQ9IMB8_9NEOP|nr:hypothetical protein PR048_002817 [Dryococelus australis]
MDLSSDEELLLLAVAEDEDTNKRKTRQWVIPINVERGMYREFATLMPQPPADEQSFYVYFRMTKDRFYEILGMIETYIRKEHTKYREPIAPEERLVITLR